MPVLKQYDREAAVRYAVKYANDRNSAYLRFTGLGGDCTNFVSQCVYAGAGVMNYTPVFGWYYISSGNRAPAWTGVNQFFDFITQKPYFVSKNGGIGPFGEVAEPGKLLPGDVIQLSDAAGRFYHTLLVCSVRRGLLYMCAHDYDALNRPLDSYKFYGLRGIHIIGVNGY